MWFFCLDPDVTSGPTFLLVMQRERTYKVQEVARMAGVSVRTLHHYDHIGLLRPARRSAAGYRLYAQPELLRLQQILLHRQRGLRLEQIRHILDDPSFDLRGALLEQRGALLRQARDMAARLQSIERALAMLRPQQMEDDMQDEALFRGFDPKPYEAEAKGRWGQTPAWSQSRQRMANYGEEDLRRFQQQQEENYQAMAEAMEQGCAANSARAMELAEAHRVLIHQWFYDCDHQTHQHLAQMYEADARFMANIDKYGQGLTLWLAQAIRNNATRTKTTP
jgi:DNA-binding transcriptional MerR regulator